MARVGIYSRSNNVPPSWNNFNEQILDGLKWMYLCEFDSYTSYSEMVEDEFADMSERIELNRLLYDAQNGNIDAVFVSDIKIFSPITIKALQTIISLQELGINVYHNNGYFDANDENIKLFKTQFEENWKRINEISKGIDFGG
jgi:DNA invertase Pin-like site-specific DNA recombinase